MLGLVIEDITGLNGATIAGVDALVAFLDSKRPVSVVSKDKIAIPPLPDGGLPGKPEWFLAPRNIPFPRRFNAKFPRYSLGWVKQKILDAAKRKKLGGYRAELTMVNSIFSHVFLENLELKSMGIKVLDVHESPRHYKILQKPGKVKWALDIIGQYDALVFASKQNRDEWINEGDIKGKKVFHIPNCCHEPRIEKLLYRERLDLRRELGIPEDKFVAVCVGGVQYRKGQDFLLERLGEMTSVAPDLELYLIGPVTLDGEAIYSRIVASEFRNLHFMGLREDAHKFISAADILLLPSRAEVMPIVLLDAMALGVPAIASAVDGVPEIVEHGKTGLLFYHDILGSFMDAFKIMAKNESERKEMGLNSKALYRNKFNRAEYIKHIKEMVDDLLN